MRSKTNGAAIATVAQNGGPGRLADFGQIVLVFQGGGALGAYQAGVYQALHESGIEPDWVIGTSIGAINASIIAGNEASERLSKLRVFWDGVTTTGIGCDFWMAPQLRQTISYWKALHSGIPNFFEPNPAAFISAHTRLGPDAAGYYSTEPLRKSLLKLVDFSCIRRVGPRLTVGAAHICTSKMKYFDSRDMELDVRHVMASGALPPAFPPVRIDGELYWDGGILSNTPSEVVFSDNPRRSSLIFAVHLWNPVGPEPQNIWEVLHRHKDIQYSSRVANQIVRQQESHRLRHVVNELAKYVPETARAKAAVRELTAYGCLTQMHVVRLLAPRIVNEDHTKDVDFSPSSIRERWDAGYAETLSAIECAPWTAPFDPLEGVILHEPDENGWFRNTSGHAVTPPPVVASMSVTV